MQVLRGVRHECEVLTRQVDGRLATLRASYTHSGVPAIGHDLAEQTERAADRLRWLVAHTTRANAVDRARVRAAVHYFLGLRNTRERRPRRSLADDLRVVHEIVRDLPAAPGQPQLATRSA